MMRILLICACLLAAVLPAAADTGTNWGAIASREGLYFGQKMYIVSDYLALQPDGSYECIAVTDEGVRVTDRGTWTLGDTQGVLHSATQTAAMYRGIATDAFLLTVTGPRDFQRLPDIRAQLALFLDSQRGSEFGFLANPSLVDLIGLMPKLANVTRAQLQEGLAAIDAALADTTPWAMPFAVRAESGFVFISSADDMERHKLLADIARLRENIAIFGEVTLLPQRLDAAAYRAARFPVPPAP